MFIAFLLNDCVLYVAQNNAITDVTQRTERHLAIVRRTRRVFICVYSDNGKRMSVGACLI